MNVPAYSSRTHDKYDAQNSVDFSRFPQDSPPGKPKNQGEVGANGVRGMNGEEDENRGIKGRELRGIIGIKRAPIFTFCIDKMPSFSKELIRKTVWNFSRVCSIPSIAQRIIEASCWKT
jgi:hypothetical protein